MNEHLQTSADKNKTCTNIGKAYAQSTSIDSKSAKLDKHQQTSSSSQTQPTDDANDYLKKQRRGGSADGRGGDGYRATEYQGKVVKMISEKDQMKRRYNVMECNLKQQLKQNQCQINKLKAQNMNL